MNGFLLLKIMMMTKEMQISRNRIRIQISRKYMMYLFEKIKNNEKAAKINTLS